MPFKSFKKMVFGLMVAVSPLVYADGAPVGTGGGGVSCDPGCTVFVCGESGCYACNKYGCTWIPKDEPVR